MPRMVYSIFGHLCNRPIWHLLLPDMYSRAGHMTEGFHCLLVWGLWVWGPCHAYGDQRAGTGVGLCLSLPLRQVSCWSRLPALRLSGVYLSLPPICLQLWVIDALTSGFMWLLGIPTQALTPGRAICSVRWAVLSAYRLVSALVRWDFKLGIVSAHFSCDFLGLCPWDIPWRWFCKLLSIYATQRERWGSLGIFPKSLTRKQMSS